MAHNDKLPALGDVGAIEVLRVNSDERAPHSMVTEFDIMIWKGVVERYDKMDRLLRHLGEIKACPQCGDMKGYTVEPSMPDGEPEQVQCQWCDEYHRLYPNVT